MICPVLSKYPDEFIPNTKVVRNRSATPDTSPTRVSNVHDTSDMTPHPDTMSGNHPEPVLHPQMNSRFVQRISFNVRAPLTLHTPFLSFVCYACCVFTVSSPPLSPVDPAATVDYTAAAHDYVVDDSTPTVELPGKQSHSPLPHIAYLSVFIYCTRHMRLLRYFLFNCIACHCRPLITFPLSYASIYKYYTTVSPALC